MITEEELMRRKLKRREALGRLIAIFTGVTAAAVMVFVVVRFAKIKIDNDLKSRATVESERQHFETNFSTHRVRRTGSSIRFDSKPRAGASKFDAALDVSTASAAPGADRPAATRAAAEAPAPKAVAAPGMGIERIEEKRSAIADALNGFYTARGVSEMLPLVRDAERVRPLMEEYYRRNRIKKRTWKAIGWLLPVEEPGYRFGYVQAIFTDAAPVNVVVEETDRGFLVDWESSVQYSEIGWKEFMVTRPVEPKTFRVLASKAQSGGGGALLSLRHPQEEGEVIGRFDQHDPRFRSLVEQLDLCKWKDVPVILRLCYPGPAAERSEVQIAGAEGKGWLILGGRSRGS